MFTGITDKQWKLFQKVLPKEPEKRGKGMPHVHFRYVLNTILWILFTGARWKDVPKLAGFASKSSAHRWLQRWKKDGTLGEILLFLLKEARSKGLIDSHRLLVDGSFSPSTNGRRKG